MHLMFAITFALLGFAPKSFSQAQNVIFITLDGVRHQDVLQPSSPLEQTLAWTKNHQGQVFGTQRDGDRMVIGDTSGVSLPGYKAIFSGLFESKCDTNDQCDEATSNTLVDYLWSIYKNPSQIALFSSWNNIDLATEGLQGRRVAQSIGLNPIVNFPFGQTSTDYLTDLPKWGDARKDRYTWEMAQDYILREHPRFTYISLDDTDEWGHLDDKRNYLKSIREFDSKLQSLLATLSRPEHANYYHNTSIVISTDHGRGEGDHFKWHGIYNKNFLLKHFSSMIEGSQYVWALVIPSPDLQSRATLVRSKRYSGSYSQLDLRPTIEKLLGVPITRGPGRGYPLIYFNYQRSR